MRCDACPARATHEWTSRAGTIALCHHHDRAYQARLTEQGWSRCRIAPG